MSQRLWMLPIAACLAALVVTLLARGGDPPAPAPPERSAQLAAPRAEPAAAPARLALVDVRDIPAPLATPQPARVAPPARAAARPAPAAAAPEPAIVAPTPAPMPAPTVDPPAPEPPPAPSGDPPAPEPPPTFDDSGSGPEFDDTGAEP